VHRSESSQQTVDTEPAYELLPSGKTLLQERLRLYGLTLLVIASGYWLAFYFIWRGAPGLDDARILAHIFAPGTFVLLAWYAGLWLLCRGKPLNRAVLPWIDLAFHAGIGLVYRALLLSHPSPVLAPFEGLLAISTVLGVRALLLPSTGARTALSGASLCFTPAVTLFAGSEHFSSSWIDARTSAALFVNWAVVAIALTGVASRVLYGLRRDVRDAQRLGQYTLVERVGEGGMGVVYRAEHALLRRPTAVKLLPQTERADSIKRFEREVQLMAELTHPNTVAIYDYGRTADGVFYYAMEYLDGVDLEGLVAIGGPQPPARVIHLLRQICGSLDEAHARGLIHRDVKPANLFVCRKRSEPDTIKVLDFGLVKDVLAADAGITVSNMVIGTPQYMAPEAWAAPDALDARSDVYSLGAVAYLLLCGSPLFSGESAIEICAKHLHSEPDPPSQRLGQLLPLDLEAIVISCLAKSPDARPASARALREGLDRCADAGRWHEDDAERWWQREAAAIEARRRRRAGAPGERTVIVDRGRDPDASRTQLELPLRPRVGA
jgi:serine/threonine-protein kinase